MIEAKFYVKESGVISGFEISGHSGYSDSGSDIVCAAVSSAAYMTVNTLSDVMMIDLDVTVNDDLGIMNVKIFERDFSKYSQIIMGFKKHLILLEEMYPKNIKVSYLEV